MIAPFQLCINKIGQKIDELQKHHKNEENLLKRLSNKIKQNLQKKSVKEQGFFFSAPLKPYAETRAKCYVATDIAELITVCTAAKHQEKLCYQCLSNTGL